jgi:hypothetical protein
MKARRTRPWRTSSPSAKLAVLAATAVSPDAVKMLEDRVRPGGPGMAMSEADKTARPAGQNLSGSVVLFAVKTCIVAVVISISTIFVANWLIESLEDSTAQTIARLRETSIGGHQFWAKIEHELDRAADPASDLPPAKKHKLVNDVRVIVARWRPFIDAVQDELKKPAGAN